VQIAQRFVDHWNETGEFPWDELDRDAVFVIDPGSFVAGTYRGRDGIRTLLRLTAEVFDEFRYEVDEWVDLGESIVALGRIRARGAQSGATGTQPGAFVIQVRDGKIVSYRSYLRREDALEAVGVPEQATSHESAELAHQAFAALNRRDLSAFLGLMDDDVEASPRVGAIEGGYHGHDGIRRWWEQLIDFLPDVVIENVALRDLGEVTLAALRMRRHGAGGNTPLDETFWSVAEWRDGKCVWWGDYGTEAEALQAVGLRASPHEP
jgi:ketosteroid isomerase-like protein